MAMYWRDASLTYITIVLKECISLVYWRDASLNALDCCIRDASVL